LDMDYNEIIIYLKLLIFMQICRLMILLFLTNVLKRLILR